LVVVSASALIVPVTALDVPPCFRVPLKFPEKMYQYVTLPPLPPPDPEYVMLPEVKVPLKLMSLLALVIVIVPPEHVHFHPYVPAVKEVKLHVNDALASVLAMLAPLTATYVPELSDNVPPDPL
jgi:hypothetical protein